MHGYMQRLHGRATEGLRVHAEYGGQWRCACGRQRRAWSTALPALRGMHACVLALSACDLVFLGGHFIWASMSLHVPPQLLGCRSTLQQLMRLAL